MHYPLKSNSTHSRKACASCCVVVGRLLSFSVYILISVIRRISVRVYSWHLFVVEKCLKGVISLLKSVLLCFMKGIGTTKRIIRMTYTSDSPVRRLLCVVEEFEKRSNVV